MTSARESSLLAVTHPYVCGTSFRRRGEWETGSENAALSENKVFAITFTPGKRLEWLQSH